MVLAFGQYRLDIERRELRCGTELAELEPKAFDLLAFLVQHRDRVVSKNDLLEALWHGRIVSESALTTRINAVRRALGDDGTAQRLIRTFTRKGIRFVGEVTQIADRTVPDKPSIAVLPFQNLSGDPEQEYFADGMVEEITTAIARCPGLFVIARNSSYAYKGKSVDVKRMAQELGVRYVLEGSVRKAGNRVRIAGQLIDTATGAHIWAERFDGILDDIFELQDQVASGVVGAIEPQLRRVEAERAVRKPTESLDAYDLHLRAQAQAYKRNSEGLAESIRLARLALDLDPGYGPAIARIALSRGMQRQRNWISPAGPEVEEGIAMARRAIAAAGDDPWVLDFAGLALAQLAGDNHAALSALDRAIVLNPNFALAFGHRAVVLSYVNRPDEAIRAAHQAIRLSPLDPAMFSFCQALARAELAAGRYEAGLSWAEEALRENGGMPALRLKLSLCGFLDRRDEARACLSRVREFHCEPAIPGIMRSLPKGVIPELVALITEGLCRAGVPED
ncbi:MAG TPA: winged helix-turn-helix domain-containing tetratricopeptide repeat protein [Stellaceae bacterium]|nr:winged helix-turn-helix domain-containing tetratricopeptide repeat protein [Stellaceae bacterium]